MTHTYAKSRRGVWYPVVLPENGRVDLGEDWRDPVSNEPAIGIAWAEDCPENPPEPEPIILHRAATPPNVEDGPEKAAEAEDQEKHPHRGHNGRKTQ